MATLNDTFFKFVDKQTEELLNYEEAIKTLNGLQSSASVIKKSQENVNRRKTNVQSTTKYLQRSGLPVEQFEKCVPVIHVAGTKGKGTTCALCDSVLRSYGFKTGLFTSPHLINVKERIRINGSPLSSSEFTKHFWPVYNTLANNKEYENDMPPYFKFLTIMAFHVFFIEKVDVAIIEVGLGGEYDCTNVLRETPIVGITSLGLDHTSLLGSTLESIAWQKAGIMKPGSSSFTISQHSSTLDVIKERALERKSRLTVVPNVESYNWDVGNFEPSQILNASLAMQLAHAWIKWKNNDEWTSLPIKEVDEKTLNAILDCKWAGRYQIVPRGKMTYYIDGAHTIESIELCANWFDSITPRSQKRTLIFNLTKQRDAATLLLPLVKCNFDVVYFCPNIVSENSNSTPDNLDMANSSISQEEKLQEYKIIWSKMTNSSSENVFVSSSASETIAEIEMNNKTNHILVTGSLYLVGSFLTLFLPGGL